VSRQNKQAKRRAIAAEITALHKQGQRGAKRATPKKARKNWRSDSEKAKDYAAFLAKMRAEKSDAAKERFGKDTKGEFRW
jgi:hypothetical protein